MATTASTITTNNQQLQIQFEKKTSIMQHQIKIILVDCVSLMVVLFLCGYLAQSLDKMIPQLWEPRNFSGIFLPGAQPLAQVVTISDRK